MYEEEFCKRLSELRIQKGVSARDMSLSLGQNAGYINHIENRQALPSLPVFFNICEYFDITPAEFFSDADRPTIDYVNLTSVTSDLRSLKAEQLACIYYLIKELKNKS
ncbi:MAG: helix-turn-helix domain-containing protein [Lachnospiraceae bacterium]